MRNQVALSSLLFATLCATTAQAAQTPGIEITLAAGAGALEEIPGIFTIRGTTTTITPPRGEITRKNSWIVSFGELYVPDCEVESTVSDRGGCEVTLSCPNSGERFVIVPGSGGKNSEASVNGMLLKSGVIVTQCLDLSPQGRTGL